LKHKLIEAWLSVFDALAATSSNEAWNILQFSMSSGASNQTKQNFSAIKLAFLPTSLNRSGLIMCQIYHVGNSGRRLRGNQTAWCPGDGRDVGLDTGTSVCKFADFNFCQLNDTDPPSKSIFTQPETPRQDAMDLEGVQGGSDTPFTLTFSSFRCCLPVFFRGVG
jgi:hypothetical protein